MVKHIIIEYMDDSRNEIKVEDTEDSRVHIGDTNIVIKEESKITVIPFNNVKFFIYDLPGIE